MDVQRRLKLRVRVLAVVVAATTITACGSGDDSAETTAPATAAPTSSPQTNTPDTTEPDTRTVETDRGPVEVPVEPLRVVAADYYGQFPLLDVGVTPVGISGGGGVTEPYASAVTDSAIVGDYTEPRIEQVAAAEPDLIVRTIDTEDALYEQLSAIAPTVVISFEGLSLVEVAVRVGELVGKDAEAEQLVTEYNAKGAALHEQFADVIDNTTWATVSAWEGQWFLYSPAWVDNAAISAAGIKFSDATVALEGDEDYAQEQSLEQLTLLADADVLLVTATPEGGIDPTMDAITESPLWTSLPAVQAGNVFAAPQGTSSLGQAITLLNELEKILPKVTPP